METSLTTTQPNTVVSYSEEQIKVLTDTVAKGATKTELDFFLAVCKRTGLDPFTKQVYFTKRKTWNNDRKAYDEVATIQTGIDGYRVIAARTNEHAGTDDAIFFDGKGQVSETDSVPFKAKVTVYRLVRGKKISFEASARWDEYCQRNKEGKLSNLWAKMPYLMLAKCAEALALRKAFPFELSGVYTKEEMMQADTEEETKTPAKVEAIAAPAPQEPRVSDEQIERWNRFASEYPGNTSSVLGYIISTYAKDMFADLSETDGEQMLRQIEIKYPRKPKAEEPKPEEAQEEHAAEKEERDTPVAFYTGADATREAMSCVDVSRAHEIIEKMVEAGLAENTIATVKGILSGKFPELK